MPLYRFRILDKFGRTIAGQFVDRDDDNAARQHAETLTAQTMNHEVEIWQGERRVRESPGIDGDDKRPTA